MHEHKRDIAIKIRFLLLRPESPENAGVSSSDFCSILATIHRQPKAAPLFDARTPTCRRTYANLRGVIHLTWHMADLMAATVAPHAVVPDASGQRDEGVRSVCLAPFDLLDHVIDKVKPAAAVICTSVPPVTAARSPVARGGSLAPSTRSKLVSVQMLEESDLSPTLDVSRFPDSADECQNSPWRLRSRPGF